MTRPAARQMSFADLELLWQGVRLEPLLQAICDFLDRQPALVERVRRDLMRGLKQPDHGRRGLTAPQVLRALVLMRVKNWDYRELRERIADGITLRAFTNFYCEEVPKHDAFNRSFNRLTPATLKAINELVVEAAVKLGLEDGKKLRVDTTVVETDCCGTWCACSRGSSAGLPRRWNCRASRVFAIVRVLRIGACMRYSA
jgi:transposase, IS5 family